MRNLAEAELVVLAQEGNARATSILLEKMRVSMLSSMIRKFNNVSVESVEDAVQTALMKAFMNIKSYNPTYSFNTWIYRICINAIIDEKRKLKNRVTVLSLDNGSVSNEDEDMPTLGSLLPSTSLNPEETLENNDKGELAIKLLMSDKLSDNIQEVAQMYYMEELSYNEIADATDRPLGTIKAWLFRFREVTEENTPNKVKMSCY